MYLSRAHTQTYFCFWTLFSILFEQFTTGISKHCILLFRRGFVLLPPPPPKQLLIDWLCLFPPWLRILQFMSNKHYFKTLYKHIYILNTHELFRTKIPPKKEHIRMSFHKHFVWQHIDLNRIMWKSTNVLHLGLNKT